MYTEVNTNRIKRIRAMLMELGSGNFEYRLERTDKNDEIEALTILLNMTVEEIKASFFHQGYVNQNETYKHLVKVFFILDKDDNITAFNFGAKQMLLFDDDELKGKPFCSLLTDKSKLAWSRLRSKLMSIGPCSHEGLIELSLKTKQDLILTVNCLASRPIGEAEQSERIIVTSVEIVKNSKEKEINLQKEVSAQKKTDKKAKDSRGAKNKNGRINLSSADILKIREVHDHILNNLDKPLLSLRELAHCFATNEYKLKHGFKQLYGQTVFGFLIDERLKKASILIQNSDIPLKEVAHSTGFKSAPHFSRAFKEKYGYTPRDLRKRSNE